MEEEKEIINKESKDNENYKDKHKPKIQKRIGAVLVQSMLMALAAYGIPVIIKSSSCMTYTTDLSLFSTVH